MIPVYGGLITILLCTFLPPFFDRNVGKRENWSWRRALAGYTVMTVWVLVLPIFLGGNLYIDWLFSGLGVAVAASIVPVTYLGTAFVLVLSTVIFPTAVLWDISRYNKVEEPMRMILENIELLRYFAPMVLGFITLIVARTLRQKFKRS